MEITAIQQSLTESLEIVRNLRVGFAEKNSAMWEFLNRVCKRIQDEQKSAFKTFLESE